MHPNTFQHLRIAVKAAELRYITHNQQSKALHDEALSVLPGGNTRTILHTDPFPLYMKSGEGYQVTSEDGEM